MPGVEITTSVRTGPANPPGPGSARYMVAGITERGPADRALKVTSIADFVSKYGARTSYAGSVYDSLQTFFEEGGSEAWVARAVGGAAVKASITIVNRAGSPLSTLKVEAKNPGGWAGEITVQVADGTTNTVTLTVRQAGTIVETYSNQGSVAALVSAMATSTRVNAINLGAATTGVPASLPAVTAATALTSGDDDRGSVVASTVTDAANALFVKSIGPGAVAAPGYTAAQVGAALVAHSKTNGRIALLAAAVDSDSAAAIAMAAGIVADGQYAGLFFPWVAIPDGSSTRLISPEGYVAAARARAHTLDGAWKVPAGDDSAARFVLGTSPVIDQTANNTLAAGFVSGITTYGNQVRVFGWWSLASDRTQFALLRDQDFINSLGAQVLSGLDPLVWEIVDGRGALLGRVEGVLKGILQPIADAGGLYPTFDSDDQPTDDGYSVAVSTTPTGLGDNEIAAAIGVRLSPAAATIRVSITKSNLTASVTV